MVGLFSKIYGKSKDPDQDQVFKDIQRQVINDFIPLEQLGLAIVAASTNCRDKFNSKNRNHLKDRTRQEILIFREFMYFFIHISLRQASWYLSDSAVCYIKGYLIQLLSSAVIDSYFVYWPSDLKEKMTSEFYEKVNDTEKEYTVCDKEAISADRVKRSKELASALLRRLGRNISSLILDNDSNIDMISNVAIFTLREWKKMELPRLINQIRQVNWNKL